MIFGILFSIAVLTAGLIAAWITMTKVIEQRDRIGAKFNLVMVLFVSSILLLWFVAFDVI